MREGDRSVLEDLVGSDTGERYVIGEMVDMSAGGARIISMGEFAIGTRVDVTPNPKVVASSVTLTGVVRWCDAVETGHMYGLQFVDLNPELEHLLISILGSG